MRISHCKSGSQFRRKQNGFFLHIFACGETNVPKISLIGRIPCRYEQIFFLRRKNPARIHKRYVIFMPDVSQWFTFVVKFGLYYIIFIDSNICVCLNIRRCVRRLFLWWKFVHLCDLFVTVMWCYEHMLSERRTPCSSSVYTSAIEYNMKLCRLKQLLTTR